MAIREVLAFADRAETADHQLVQFVRALAASENSDFEVALSLWSELQESRPNDLTIKFNYVVNAVLLIQDANFRILARFPNKEELTKLLTVKTASQETANRYLADLKMRAAQTVIPQRLTARINPTNCVSLDRSTGPLAELK